jgi:ribosomal protein S18 acetylase RimI-like enzyme
MELGTAVPGDLPQLVELLGILFTQEHELSSDALKQRCALELILADPSRARTYVARDGGKVIAMAALHFTISTAEGGKVAGLEDCVVHPEHRRKGIGEKLLRYVLEQATAEGALRVMLLTDGDNTRAQAIYRKLGFTPSSMLAMRLKRLGGPTPHPTRSNPAHASGRLA